MVCNPNKYPQATVVFWDEWQSPYVVCNWYVRARRGEVDVESQSPYGAKWLATLRLLWAPTPSLSSWCRNPLTGLSGLQRLWRAATTCGASTCRNPLAGLSGLQRKKMTRLEAVLQKSQSPCGAMWFATCEMYAIGGHVHIGVAIPLRGYVVCNETGGVTAIFVRTRNSSQSPCGAMWFATRSVRSSGR